MNAVISKHDGNTYFLIDEEIFFCESNFDNRTAIIEGDGTPSEYFPAEESELTEEQIYNLGSQLGLPLGRSYI